ncbi:GntR family transcriptional regulator [Nocardia sp. 2YAB30]|uniref:GntR family transcriptional regulator n=1 Tax=unclassified Nocardia TaxID=2637762 RepID=UPI003F974452
MRIADPFHEEEVRAAEGKPGDRLPRHSEFADGIRVSITTARNAIQVLVTENLVHTVVSRGMIVRDQEVRDRLSPTVSVRTSRGPDTTSSKR